MAKILLFELADRQSDDLAEVLTNQGYELLRANTVRQGQKHLDQDCGIDLAIIALADPDPAALKLIQSLRSNRKFHYLPVLIFIENADDTFIKNCISSGVTDIVACSPADEALSKKIKNAVCSGKPTVLIVDDDPDMLSLLEHVIQSEGFQAVTAPDVDKAVEILAGRRVDCLISDIVMPKKNGLQLLRFVKDRHPDIPVLLITGYVNHYAADPVVAIGADGFLQKPFKNAALLFKVHRMIQSRQIHGGRSEACVEKCP